MTCVSGDVTASLHQKGRKIEVKTETSSLWTFVFITSEVLSRGKREILVHTGRFSQTSLMYLGCTGL